MSTNVLSEYPSVKDLIVHLRVLENHGTECRGHYPPHEVLKGALVSEDDLLKCYRREVLDKAKQAGYVKSTPEWEFRQQTHVDPQYWTRMDTEDKVFISLMSLGKAALIDWEMRQPIERRAAPSPPEQANAVGSGAPDTSGYVKTPADPAAYVPAADILARHAPPELSLSMKNLATILADYGTNHVRWTRPLGKSGRPRRNRRSVHLGDWAAYLKRRIGDDNGFPHLTETEIERRRIAVRNTKHAGK